MFVINYNLMAIYVFLRDCLYLLDDRVHEMLKHWKGCECFQGSIPMFQVYVVERDIYIVICACQNKN